MNKVTISGNITRDIESKFTQSGMAIASFGVAVNERRKKGEEWVDTVHFIDVTAFGKKAEAIAQYMQKGSKILIDGKLDFQQWEKDGQKRSKLAVILNEFEFMGGKQEGQAQMPPVMPPREGYQSPQNPTYTQAQQPRIQESDIPQRAFVAPQEDPLPF